VSEFLKLFFEILKEHNIRYCVLRNYESLPKSLNGSDLDILISKEDIFIFYKLLNTVLSKAGGEIIIQYGKLTPRVCIAGIVDNKLYGVQLDVHEGILPYKTNNMFPVDFLLARNNKHNGIDVANDDDANILAFLKEVFNNGICKEKYFNDAKISWDKNGLLYKKVLLPIYDDKFTEMLSDIFKTAYNQEKISELSRYGISLLTKELSTKIDNFKSKLSRYYRFFNPPGFTIAVLGTDGAGKTTIIDAISEPLNEAVHNALYYEHMRPNLIPNIAQALGKKQHDGPVTDPHSAKPSGLAGSLLRLFYYSFDYIVGYWIKIYPVTVKKSSIWIFDRYYYDYLIDPKRARINLPSWIIRGVGVFIPKPDLILCLGANPSVIHDRKPELPLDEVTEQVDKLKSLCENTKNAVWIDTGKSLAESVQTTYETIINKMASRYN